MIEKSDNSIKVRSLEILLNKYRYENEFLKSQNEYLKKYRNHIVAYTLILSSAIIFLLCILFTENLQFIFLIFTTVALISLAIYLIFIYSHKTYPLKIFSSALKIAVNNFAQILTNFQLGKNSIFLPANDTVYQFIPFASGLINKELPASSELNRDIFEIENRGIILHPIGFSIVELLKIESNINLREIDLDKLEVLLQEIIIDQLNLAKTLNFVKLDKGRYKLILTENFLNNFSHLAKNNIKFDLQIGCPIYSFVAILLSWNTDRSILLNITDFNARENISTVIYELGDLYH